VGGKRVKGNTGKSKATKKVTQSPSPPADQRYLIWRFGRLDYGGLFACRTLAPVDAPGLEQELVVFQQHPIYKLLEHNWLKFISTEEMTADGRKRLLEVNPQESGLWQLHLHRDKWRIWGYYEPPEFCFLWWDSTHGVATGRSRSRKPL
jgi:hypothetical protein